jgi:hypothetical protein
MGAILQGLFQVLMPLLTVLVKEIIKSKSVSENNKKIIVQSIAHLVYQANQLKRIKDDTSEAITDLNNRQK